MTLCRICGTETPVDVTRFWDPDDGWRYGTLCPDCKRRYGKLKPKRASYADRVAVLAEVGVGR